MKLSIVIPCFNEEEALGLSFNKLAPVLDRLVAKQLVDTLPDVYLVDDGSTDKTWQIITTFTASIPNIHGIKLSRNYGHQNALLAGLSQAKGDAVITLDADLQDDIEIIDEMVNQHKKGFEIVYGVRKDRTTDTPFKRKSATLFYSLMTKFGARMIPHHADFRLIGRRALNHLEAFHEFNFFLRGIVPLLGFKSTQVTYSRAERIAGETKYSLIKMLSFALNGITSFSVMPLRIIAILGVLIFLFSLFVILWVLVIKWGGGDAVPGWASTMIPLTLLGGLQLFSLGVVGEYVGKIYQEIKARPRFIIEEVSTPMV